MELKQGVALKVPVRFRSVVDGSPLTGVTYGQVSVYLQKSGGASVLKALSPSDWTEVDATNMPGEYDLQLSTIDLDTVGFLRYYVSDTGVAITYSGLLQVVAYTNPDIIAILGTPAGASISADIAASAANIGRILGLVFDNIVEDSQIYDTNGHLTSAHIRCYDSKTHAQSAGATGLLYQYTVTATYDINGNATLFQVVREL